MECSILIFGDPFDPPHTVACQSEKEERPPACSAAKHTTAPGTTGENQKRSGTKSLACIHSGTSSGNEANRLMHSFVHCARYSRGNAKDSPLPLQQEQPTNQPPVRIQNDPTTRGHAENL
mmetsp:Transcript_13544/g.38115  ORF Transcript_13544/g.38115 Transcript_13544/m.38115 type:complete len:120 (+) Transcript_13544:92-451(+)